MRKKQNPMKYFSGSAVTRLPLHKLLAGALAVAMAASLGVGAMAAGVAGVLPGSSPSPSPSVSPSPSPTPSASHSPSPSPTPAPVQVDMDITVIQQNIGVMLYTLEAPKAGGPSASPSASPSPSATPAGQDEAAEPDRMPLLGVEATVTMTDAAGTVQEYPVDTVTGTLLVEDMEPGDYTVALTRLAHTGYLLPQPETVTVEKKVEYKADIEAVKDQIVQAKDVNESSEDSGYGNGGSAPIVDEVTDTVAYAESSQVETGRQTTYIPELENGYLKLQNGTVTPYKPVYENNVFVAAVREEAPVALSDVAAGIWLPLRLPGLLSTLPIAAPEAGPTDPVPGDTLLPPADEQPTDTPAPPATEQPTDTPAPPPSDAPATDTPAPPATEQPTDTPAPPPSDAPATDTPAPPATETPTPTPDAYAGWPARIEAAALAGEPYGFAVTAQETVTYEYTGWQTIDGKRAYYDPATHQPVTGTQVIQGVIYQFSENGTLNDTTRGIDVSKYQRTINWNAVKADGIDFAIIRVGYRGYGSGALVEDSAFKANLRGAVAAGLRVGVYFYSQAVDEAEAVQEASMVLSLIGGYSMPMGVWYDTEKVANDTGRADTISAAQRTACAVAFCETIRNAGYTPGVYSYASWFYNQLNFANISKYRTWIAQYRDQLDFKYKYDIWQYTGSGHVNGVPTEVDMNIG